MEIITAYSLAIVLSMFVLFAVAEVAIPMNKNHGRLGFRWFTNLMLLFIVVIVYKLLGPTFAILSALLVEYLGIGVFNQVELSLPLVLLSGIVILDFKQYWFHRLMHYFDFLWCVHRVHHSDIEIDLTTGFRFHPLEAILSALFDLLVVAIFGIAVEVLLLRYLLIFFANFFSHGNIRIAAMPDRVLKWVLVTPSMHHLHHALDKRAANSNFGVLFSFWDRMFSTYLDKHPQTEDKKQQPGMVYGISECRQPRLLNLYRLMLMPFRISPAGQAQSRDDA